MPKTLYSDRYYSIVQPDNGDTYISCDNEVVVVPIHASGHVILISEPSSAFGDQCLLLPGGIVDDGETCSVAANRELQEEVGYAANSLSYLGEFRPFSKYLAVKTFVFVGRNLMPNQMIGDEDHEIEKHLIAGDDLLGFIRDGRINDARVIAALFMSGVVSLPWPSSTSVRSWHCPSASPGLGDRLLWVQIADLQPSCHECAQMTHATPKSC